MRARVENGRVRLDEPTELPDGTILDPVVDDGDDELSDAERRALHTAISAALDSAKAGPSRPAQAVIDELRRR